MADSAGFTLTALDETIGYLASDAAQASLEANVYWPKWSSPWWRMTLLYELGLASEIPERASKTMLRAFAAQTLPFFPLTSAELPPGRDPVDSVTCHCAAGTLYQLLTACGLPVDAELPWLRKWFVRYQLPDGGLNCDEAAYLRPTPRSSYLSTLPPLEAILYSAPRPLSDEEVAFLDRGAKYLLDRQLIRSLSKGGALADERWLQPCFPRFYDYDLLRGLAFLVRWATELGRELPVAAVGEAASCLAAGAGGGLRAGRIACADARTRRRDEAGVWVYGSTAERFPLLDEVCAVGAPSPWLARSWAEVSAGLARLRRPSTS